MSDIRGHGFFEIPDKFDGIADEESKGPILALVILVAIFCEEDVYSLRCASLKSPTWKQRLTPSSHGDSRPPVTEEKKSS